MFIKNVTHIQLFKRTFTTFFWGLCFHIVFQ